VFERVGANLLQGEIIVKHSGSQKKSENSFYPQISKKVFIFIPSFQVSTPTTRTHPHQGSGEKVCFSSSTSLAEINYCNISCDTLQYIAIRGKILPYCNILEHCNSATYCDIAMQRNIAWNYTLHKNYLKD